MRHGPQLDGECVHLGLGELRRDLGPAVTERIHATDATSLGVEQTHHVARVALWNGDAHIHNRLEQHGIGLLHRLAHGHGPRDLKRDVLAVDRVRRAVHQAHLHVHDRVAADRSLLDGLPDALLHRWPELLWYGAAEDLVLPLVATATRQRLDLDGRVAVETGAA